MSAARHTPGPWEIIEHPTESTEIRGGVQAATAIARVWCGDMPDGAANAHLITAAPDLLAACGAVLALCEQLRAGTERVTYAEKAARAAIAKAKGESS